MSTPRVLAAACVAMVALAACTGGGTPSPTTPVSPTSTLTTSDGSAVPVPSPTPLPPAGEMIRDVDFANLTWRDALRSDARIKLSDGSFSSGDFTWTLREDLTVFSDANGDGFEDALVFYDRTSDQGAVTSAYIWWWDASQDAPAQVVDPVGEYSACFHSFVSAEPDPTGGFVLNEKLRDLYDYQSCEAEPLHSWTRTVAVDQGRLIMVKPYLAYGGVCYQTYGSNDLYNPPVRVHVAPDAAAPLAIEAAHIWPEMPEYNERDWPTGWRQVRWVTEEMVAAGHLKGVCGFIWER